MMEIFKSQMLRAMESTVKNLKVESFFIGIYINMCSDFLMHFHRISDNKILLLTLLGQWFMSPIPALISINF